MGAGVMRGSLSVSRRVVADPSCRRSLGAWAVMLAICPLAFSGNTPTQTDGRSNRTTIPVSEASGPTSWLSTVRLVSVEANSVIADYDRPALADAARRGGRITLERFPLTHTRVVDLELEPFHVTSANTRFVVGRKGEPDRPFDFDPSSVTLLRGHVAGVPASDVFLALAETQSTGHVQLSLGGERYEIASASADAVAGGVRSGLRIFRGNGAQALPAGLPMCGVEERAGITIRRGEHAGSARVAGGPLVRGTLHIELALETDYELYALFGDLTAEATYLTELMGAVSHIYLRDVNAHYEVTFVRMWDDPNDLFNVEDPLDEFVTYWTDNMGAVQRDVAHFASGRRNMPYGGVAYIGALCSDFAYGLTGYLTGQFPDPDVPSSGHYDVHVVAHELGHNCGTGHTHGYGVDDCDNFNGTPQRGTIMSYCSQTYSGGGANWDAYFHSFIEIVMEDFMINETFCLATDCNRNNTEDSLDIFERTSQDTNSNGIPDECEDCDDDGILDPAEIAGPSNDVDGNNIPDECEPDCNNNGLPDHYDTSVGDSFDTYGNHIPDECEEDCDNNSVSDYTQIQVNMALDLNRNAVLDSCEDCDGDAITDLVELNGAWSLWSASGNADRAIREFHADVGTRIRISAGGQVDGGQDLIITPSGRILVSAANTDRVVEFNRTGGFVGILVATGSGGLDYPTGMTLMPNGDLLVSSRNTNSVLRYNGITGASMGAFVASGSGGLVGPFGIAYGPNGNLFVTSSNGRVLQYSGAGGAFVGEYVTAADNGGLIEPRGIAFKPNGNLLVASFATNQVLEYAAGTGAFIGQFNDGGTSVALTMDEPWGVRVGPNGHVFVARHNEALVFEEHEHPPGVEELHLNATRIYMFDVDTGIFLRSFVTGNDTGMIGTTGFDFMPGETLDCNLNFHPDNCDIAEGISNDANSNGIPDECDCVVAGVGPSPDPSGLTKSRYLSFSVSGVGPDVGLRVTLTNLDGFPGSNGQIRWAAPAVSYPDVGTGGPSFSGAVLQCNPHYADWSGLGLLHVYGGEVVPGSTYTIDAISECTGETLGSLEVTTGKWGDIVAAFGGPTQPNFADVSALVTTFQAQASAPSVTRSDLVPVVPNQVANFADISIDVAAFSGASYPFTVPGPCP